ncbi:hypothetical protein [Terriglobus tenax]|uniref:hypothetical protein n=1 Tax=Terriglobus tenax TaxID=1111115 RepID=UPI0021DFE56E|nr:hypothetical protein [Terriglobus tenax]
MDQSLGARRNEDIALDLMKFIASTVHIAKPAAGSTGFGASAAPQKTDDQVNQILELYARCKKAVEG